MEAGASASRSEWRDTDVTTMLASCSSVRSARSERRGSAAWSGVKASAASRARAGCVAANCCLVRNRTVHRARAFPSIGVPVILLPSLFFLVLHLPDCLPLEEGRQVTPEKLSAWARERLRRIAPSDRRSLLLRRRRRRRPHAVDHQD